MRFIVVEFDRPFFPRDLLNSNRNQLPRLVIMNCYLPAFQDFYGSVQIAAQSLHREDPRWIVSRVVITFEATQDFHIEEKSL